MAKEETNKVKLARIEGLLDRVLEWQSNHMEHHKKLYDRLFRVFLVALSPLVAGILGLIVWVVVSIIKSS